jgi:hypothetical protein
VAWAKERGLAHLLKTDESLPHAVVDREWKETQAVVRGFVPPGCRVVDAEETFFANPSEVG